MKFTEFLTCNSAMKAATALLVITILAVLLAIIVPQYIIIAITVGFLAIIHCIAFSIKGSIQLYSHE